ncbi:MAG: cobyric acid synthase [Elusimicrobia bacterium]|nr:cobyric acid synthase [Elusimicrobiota bacterium]
MAAKTLMVQGTGSSVGKSMLVTALCRLFHLEGARVAPFKTQNMSNNSAIAKEGGEIGRAQAEQARACGLRPSVDMNPILLKPQSDRRSQVLLIGRPIASVSARGYHRLKPRVVPEARAALDRLRAGFELVILEGAGSPAEINLRRFDIVNMTAASWAQAPVLLVADIDKGGVFASLIGTMELLTEEERRRVKGFVINKFRGDVSILKPGLVELERRTGVPVLGVIPHLSDLRLAQEDSALLETSRSAGGGGKVLVEVLRLPRISNHTDFETLSREPGVSLRYVDQPQANRFPDLLIIPGTKSTMADLRELRRRGLDRYVLRCAAAGAQVAGICGGYQMLGRKLFDPAGAESARRREDGLGLLAVDTRFSSTKATFEVRGTHNPSGADIRGYEIHMGRTTRRGGDALLKIVERQGRRVRDEDGSASLDGNVWGTYVHGLFDSAPFRRQLLKGLRRAKGLSPLAAKSGDQGERALDALARVVGRNLDMKRLRTIVRQGLQAA